MGHFRAKRPQNETKPDEPRMPAVGETVSVRVDGGTRVWLAEVQMVSDDLLVVQLDLKAYRSERDPISIGQHAYVTGLGNSGVLVRAQARGHNGSLLLLKSPTVVVDRPKRTLERAETVGKVWCTAHGGSICGRVEVFDLSAGGICTSTMDGMEVGQFVTLSQTSQPDTAGARGVIVGLKTTVERGGQAHIAFVAGTNAATLKVSAQVSS